MLVLLMLLIPYRGTFLVQKSTLDVTSVEVLRSMKFYFGHLCFFPLYIQMVCDGIITGLLFQVLFTEPAV